MTAQPSTIYTTVLKPFIMRYGITIEKPNRYNLFRWCILVDYPNIFIHMRRIIIGRSFNRIGIMKSRRKESNYKQSKRPKVIEAP